MSIPGHLSRERRPRRRWSRWLFGAVCALGVIGVLIWVGLFHGSKPQVRPSSSAPAMVLPSAAVSVPPNDLKAGSFTAVLKGLNGQLTVAASFTTKYDANHWQILGAKDVNIDVHATAFPKGATVVLNSLHVTVSLVSSVSTLDGRQQASFDYSGASVRISDAGFAYAPTLSIPPNAPAIASEWRNETNSTGPLRNLRDKNFTEANLRSEGGVIGNRFVVTMSVLVDLHDNRAGLLPANIPDISFFVPVG